MYPEPDDFNAVKPGPFRLRLGMTLYRAGFNPVGPLPLVCIERYRLERATVSRLYLTRLHDDGTEQTGNVFGREYMNMYPTEAEAWQANCGPMKDALNNLDIKVADARVSHAWKKWSEPR